MENLSKIIEGILFVAGEPISFLDISEKLEIEKSEVEEAIKELATKFIFISAMLMPVCAFCHSTYFTLRSGGKTVVTFIFDSVYTWLVVIPVAYSLSHFTTWGIVPVFFCVQSLEFIKAIIGFFMVKSGVWLQNIVAEKETR